MAKKDGDLSDLGAVPVQQPSANGADLSDLGAVPHTLDDFRENPYKTFQDNDINLSDSLNPAADQALAALHNSENAPAIKAGLEGAGQGASLGFSDELEALLKSGKISGSEYDAAINSVRQRMNEEKQTHPLAFGAGNLAGSLVPAAAAGLATGGPGAGLAANMAAGAALGSAGGVGYSENSLANNPSGVLKDAGIGGAVGTAFPLMGELLGPAETTVGGLARTGAGAGLAAGTGALLDPNNPTQGAKNGAGLFLGAKGAGMAMGAIANSGIGNIAKRAKELGEQGVVLSNSQDYLNKYASDLHDVSVEANKLAKLGVDTKNSVLTKRLGNLEDEMDRFLTTTKHANGQGIGEIHQLLADTNTDIYVKDMADKVHSIIDDSTIPEDLKGQLRKKLNQMVEITTPDLAVTNRSTTNFNPETGNFTPGNSVNKVGAKAISADDLASLQAQSTQQTPGNASISTLTGPNGNPISQTTSQQTLLSQPVQAKSVNLKQLLDYRNSIAQNLQSSDPKERALASAIYGQVSDKIKSLIKDPDMLAQYNQFNKNYSGAMNLSGELVDKDGDLKKQVANQALNFNNGTISTGPGDLQGLLGRIKNLESPDLQPAGTAGTADAMLGNINQLSDDAQQAKTLSPLANPVTGIKTATGQILENDKLTKNVSPWKQNIDLMKQIDPDRAAQLEQKASQISDTTDLLGLNKSKLEGDALPTSMGGIVKTIAGGVKSNLAISANRAGLVSRAMMDNPEISQSLAAQATKNGYTDLARILTKATTADKVSRAATLYTIQSSPAFNQQFQNLLKGQEPSPLKIDTDDNVSPDTSSDE